jgi:hypothetical protein
MLDPATQRGQRKEPRVVKFAGLRLGFENATRVAAPRSNHFVSLRRKAAFLQEIFGPRL